MVDDLGERMVDRQVASKWLLHSRVACIPKGEYLEDAKGVVGRASELRLITPMNMIAEVFAPKRGIIRARSIDDNRFELAGARQECSDSDRKALQGFGAAL